jgi:uncharacterized protein
MFILLISDTHGNTQGMERVIKAYKQVDMVLHLGDFVKDAQKLEKAFPNIRFEYVPGNNDWTSAEPNDKMIEVMGKKLFLTHGHRYKVKTSLKTLIQRGNESGADAVFYGHTHLADEFLHEKVLFLNPGSLGTQSLYQGPTFVELSIDDLGIQHQFITLS